MLQFYPRWPEIKPLLLVTIALRVFPIWQCQLFWFYNTTSSPPPPQCMCLGAQRSLIWHCFVKNPRSSGIPLWHIAENVRVYSRVPTLISCSRVFWASCGWCVHSWEQPTRANCRGISVLVGKLFFRSWTLFTMTDELLEKPMKSFQVGVLLKFSLKTTVMKLCGGSLLVDYVRHNQTTSSNPTQKSHCLWRYGTDLQQNISCSSHLCKRIIGQPVPSNSKSDDSSVLPFANCKQVLFIYVLCICVAVCLCACLCCAFCL